MARTTERVRHKLRFRIAKVVRTERLTPRMARITLHDPDFSRFRSDAYDDHVKLFFAPPGGTVELPVAGPNGLEFKGPRPDGRDYTPRSFNLDRAEVVIDFVLHGDGPAASWAAKAVPGDSVGVGGPRASFVVSDDFDWYLLAGDETALPAIGRRIEELPKNANILAFIEIADEQERQDFEQAGNLELHWIDRAKGQDLAQAIREATLPEGIGYAFIAGEASLSAGLRDYLVNERGIDPANIKAAGYWRAGESDFYDGHQH